MGNNKSVAENMIDPTLYQQGGGQVYTCADPHCNQKINGIQLSYAVAALEGRHVG